MRKGDNYKAFGEDAKRIAQILGTTLVRVNGTDETGFPHQAPDTNLIAFHLSGMRNLKYCYLFYVCKHMFEEFPSPVS
jgi:hypothetical protein